MTQSLSPGAVPARGVSWGERGRRAGASVLTGLVAVPLFGAAAAGAAPAADDLSVIVRHRGGAEAVAERSVELAGGDVGRSLDLIDSFTAEVPADAVARLRTAPGVAEVTPDGSVHLQGSRWRPDLERDRGAFGRTLRNADVDRAHRRRDADGDELSGKGVTVALIDSGVVPVDGLDDEGKVVNGPDLSFESQSDESRYLDTFGHGTHMAGIIAGRDSDFTGVAPDARLLSLKVAAADGATDVSQVIAALDWVVQHRNDDGMAVRVVNLSFGTESVQPYVLDPLAHAAEVAWRRGIVVVVSAGNNGNATERLTDPAMDPYVLAVGASDDLGTDRRDDDVVTEFSNRGSLERTPDLVAPGRSIQSLRNPGSYIDEAYPTARVATTDGSEPRYFRGSGTSQSAAFVSGVVALLLQQRPELNPDQVKAILTSTADRLGGTDERLQGAGLIDVSAAMRAPTPWSFLAAQRHPVSTGLGSLEEARGGSHVADPETGIELVGEQDIFGQPWDGRSWSLASWEGRSWSGGDWNGSSWSGSSWSGRSWSGRSWSGSSWSGRSWSGRSWSDASWSGRSWSGRSWSGRSWSDALWSGRSWSGRSWSDSNWSGNRWS
ncbi:MAG: peptidase and in kexin sedolisin [Acidimicrobiales bacterium]|nr:peptidase and in kexin sedolisin [Acidimicrobiales bacterium]